MFQQFYFSCVNLIFYFNFLTAAVNSRRPMMVVTTFKPSTLLLPPGFDSQPVPRQPMLYPYAVAPPVLPTRPSLRTIKPITTADWVPLAINAKHDSLQIPPILASTRPIPLFEERIPSDAQHSSSPSSNDGPVFESIIYGTWKPDPPLQPVKILNDTKILNYQHQQHQQQQLQQQLQHHQQQQNQSNRFNNDGSIYNSSYGGLFVNGTFYNKTINRQHGGFIGHIQQKPTKVDRPSLEKQNSDNSLSNSSSAEYKSKESREANSELMVRKIKKQGRQKIRPNSQTTEQTAIEKSSAVDSITTTSTAKPMTTKQSQTHQLNVIKVNATDPKIMEVVKQFNESAEIIYNHKQTSTHSIDMTVTTAPNRNHYDEDADEDYSSGELGVSHTQSATVSSIQLSTQLQTSDDDLENISATRRSWPTDFMNTPLTTATDENWNDSYTNDGSVENHGPDIPTELSALNIPPSLWPKLPGNITKFGIPYETKSSAEEPALCVPITVQEQNIMNSKEFVFIERIFCFPKPPSSTLSEYSSEERIKTFNPTISTRAATRAKVQNFNDFLDSNMGATTNCAISNFKNHLNLVTFILLINFKFIFLTKDFLIFQQNLF